MKTVTLCGVAAASLTSNLVLAQRFYPATFPHVYPGMPTGDYSAEWQKCASLSCLSSLSQTSHVCTDFQVTQPLPNVTWDLGRNWAGNIPVNRAEHPNNTLFFWGFEKENGSLTAAAGERSDEPWAIWLNGGEGYAR